MAFKLFKNAEDEMKEALLFGTTPVGKDIKVLLDQIGKGNYDPFQMVKFKTRATYERPPAELASLKNSLRMMRVDLALCEDAGIYFADLGKMSLYKDQILRGIPDKESEESGLGWVFMIRNYWDNTIPMAGVKVFMEGFEIKIFTKGQKVRKEFVTK